MNIDVTRPGGILELENPRSSLIFNRIFWNCPKYNLQSTWREIVLFQEGEDPLMGSFDFDGVSSCRGTTNIGMIILGVHTGGYLIPDGWIGNDIG